MLLVLKRGLDVSRTFLLAKSNQFAKFVYLFDLAVKTQI
jgi:hypothetical protein